ncbi:MAG: hypothetical protein ACRDZ7_22840 [Acidimicrobiia bacterium]
MKRLALSILGALLPASVLVGGMAAHANVAAITPMPYAPDAATVGSMVEGTLADAGLPVDLAGIPFADIDAVIASVTASLPALPVDVPIAQGVATDAETVVAEAHGALAGVEETVAGLPLELPLDVPALPAIPDAAGLVATVTGVVGGLGLPVPLDTPALPAVPEVAGVLAQVQETIAGLGLSLPGI